jgi:hypothetical protein
MISAERKWRKVAGASPDELAALRSIAPDLPEPLIELLAYSNGGEGPLAVQPQYFQLYSAKDITDSITSPRDDFTDFLIFGSNGGGEYIAMKRSSPEPWPVVYIDMVAGPDSEESIAPDIESFISLIGECDEQA